MKKSVCFPQATRMVLSLALGVTMATFSLAQEPLPAAQVVPAMPVPGGGFGAVPGLPMPSKEKLGGAKQYQLLSIYAMEIRRIDAAVKLEDAQKTKLNVGAKGLAKKKSQEFVRNMTEMGWGMAIPIGGAAPAAKPEDAEPNVTFSEVKSFADIEETTKQMLDGGFAPETKPYDDPNWNKLVKAVLKPEQYSQYEQAIATQKLNADKAMVNAGVAALSLELVLNKDQENKIAELVLEQMAKPKAAPGTDSPAEAGFVMVIGMDGSRFKMELAKVEPKLLREVLAPEQFELLEFRLSSLRQTFNMMNGDAIELPDEGK